MASDAAAKHPKAPFRVETIDGKEVVVVSTERFYINAREPLSPWRALMAWLRAFPL